MSDGHTPKHGVVRKPGGNHSCRSALPVGLARAQPARRSNSLMGAESSGASFKTRIATMVPMHRA